MDRKWTFLLAIIFTAVAILGSITETTAGSNYKETGVSEYLDNIKIKGVRAISTIGETSYIILSSPGYCAPAAAQEIIYRFEAESSVKVIFYNRYIPRQGYRSGPSECEGIEVIHDRPIRH